MIRVLIQVSRLTEPHCHRLLGLGCIGGLGAFVADARIAASPQQEAQPAIEATNKAMSVWLCVIVGGLEGEEDRREG